MLGAGVSHSIVTPGIGVFKTATRISDVGDLIEHFIAAPPSYRQSYTYQGVHNICSKDGTTCHEVFVPGVDSVIGAGDDLNEALKEARIKLTIMLRDIQDRGDPLPPAPSEQDVHAVGQEHDRSTNAGFTLDFCGTVSVTTLPDFKVPKLPEAEWAATDAEIRRLWCEMT
jgi:predicted RNase H-like HicB family nuclease